MTLQEAKDEIARKHRFKDWEDLVLQFQAKNYVDEVSELYARSKWDEACKEQKLQCMNRVLSRKTIHKVFTAQKPEFKP
jgi:hypothetical protein